MCITLFTPEEIFKAATDAAKRKDIEEHAKLMALYHKQLAKN